MLYLLLMHRGHPHDCLQHTASSERISMRIRFRRVENSSKNFFATQKQIFMSKPEMSEPKSVEEGTTGIDILIAKQIQNICQ